MKKLNQFILEKLKISSKIYKEKYSYMPKTRDELREILEERLSKDKNANLNDIDVSEITDMGITDYGIGLFEGLDPHNIDISEWDMSNVTNIKAMFYRCENFTGKGLENWNVSKVTNMRATFTYCSQFNSDLNNWDVSNVKDMLYIFHGCYSLKNKPSWYEQ